MAAQLLHRSCFVKVKIYQSLLSTIAAKMNFNDFLVRQMLYFGCFTKVLLKVLNLRFQAKTDKMLAEIIIRTAQTGWGVFIDLVFEKRETL